VASAPEPLSPEWWTRRLYRQLEARREHVELMDAYYRGVPPSYPWLPAQAHDEFRRLLGLIGASVMGLVADATAERMTVEGFRIGDSPESDKETWRLWQANNLDGHSSQGILEAVKSGQSYTLTAPNPNDAATPLIFVEHPSQAIVEYEPGTSRRVRAAGLKVWEDDWTGKLMSTLYLPGWLFKFEADKPRTGTTWSTEGPRWERREVRGESWPAKNPLGVVPLVEIANNPSLLTGGVSELADVRVIQDRICKTIADRLMTQDFGAFPQKWAIGFPSEDADGNPQRIDVGRNRMVTSDVAETRFGQWDAAALAPYLEAKREDVKDIASRTRTPAQYLLGELNNVNGETLRAAESGLVSKVRSRMVPMGEGFEETMRLARRAAGSGGGDEAMETIWRNPEFRTEGELVDALVKMAGLGVPQEALWERWGASQEEIRRWKTMQADQVARQTPVDLASFLTLPAGNENAADQSAS
jgi:hypothetical protein